MNFDEAIKAHSAWKMKLQQYLNNPDNSIDADKLGKDNVCDLGHWLYHEGTKHSAIPEFKDLLENHKEFHKSAASIVMKKNKGEDVKGDIALGASSSFSKASMNVVSLIMKLRTKI